MLILILTFESNRVCATYTQFFLVDFWALCCSACTWRKNIISSSFLSLFDYLRNVCGLPSASNFGLNIFGIRKFIHLKKCIFKTPIQFLLADSFIVSIHYSIHLSENPLAFRNSMYTNLNIKGPQLEPKCTEFYFIFFISENYKWSSKW